MLESRSARQAIKRSVALTKGTLWRLLIVAVLMTLIRVVLVMLCQAPFSVAAFLIAFKGGQPSLWLTIPSLLVGGVAGIATAPAAHDQFRHRLLRLARSQGRLRPATDDVGTSMPPIRHVGTTSQVQMKEGPPGGRQRCWMHHLNLHHRWNLPAHLVFAAPKGLEQPAFSGENRPLPRFVALVGFIANFCLPIVGRVKWGSWVEAENILGPLHPLILLVAGIIMVVQCFKVRRILLDHLAPQQEGMFSASIRFQYDDLLSRMGTFFLGIFYLQYKINGLLDRLTPAERWARGDDSISGAGFSPSPRSIE